MFLYQIGVSRCSPDREPPGTLVRAKHLPGRRVVNSRKLTGKVVKGAVTKQEQFTYLESAW